MCRNQFNTARQEWLRLHTTCLKEQRLQADTKLLVSGSLLPSNEFFQHSTEQPPLAGGSVTSAAAQVSFWRSDSFFSISQNLQQLEPVKLAASPTVLLESNPMERAKACSKSRTRAKMPKEDHTGRRKRSLWRALFLSPHLSDASKPDPLGWDSLPFNPVGVINSLTHKGSILHAASPSQTVPVLLQHHSGQREVSREEPNGQKEKKKKKSYLPVQDLATGAELKLPRRHWLTALTCLLLTSAGKMPTFASLKQIPFYFSVCQIGQVSNPMGLSALKGLCEWLSRTP